MEGDEVVFVGRVGGEGRGGGGEEGGQTDDSE